MANHELAIPPVFNANLRKYEIEDEVHADVFNAVENQLINNDSYLKSHIDTAEQNIKEHKETTDIHVTKAQKDSWTAKATTTEATPTTKGLMSSVDKIKLNGIAAGAEVNQNAFSNVKVGSTVVEANRKTATIEIAGGTNIAITADNATKKVTINGPSNVTTSINGLMTKEDKIKLNNIATNANNYAHPTYPSKTNGLYKVTVDGTGHVSATNAVTKADITALGIPAQDTNTTYGAATTSTLGLVKSGTDITVDSSGNVSVVDDSHNHVISNVDGLQSALDAKAASSHTHANYVNQNAFSNVTVGSTTIAADNTTDTLTLTAGSNITLTPDATNDKITISATDTKYTHPSYTSKVNGLYKVTVDGTGHVSATSPVTKADITTLGIASSDSAVFTNSISMGRKEGTALGGGSTALGGDVAASGTYSHAEGDSTIASAKASHAEGYYTNASGDYSHAEGLHTIALSSASHAEGDDTTASGVASHAEGESTKASGKASHAEGTTKTAESGFTAAQLVSTSAYGIGAHAEGLSTTAGQSSSNTIESGAHAEGICTIATGIGSHAEGIVTTASGTASHAEGRKTNATGVYSHAEGYSTSASGNYSHAEGSGTTASGVASHAEGDDTTASKLSSHAEGYGTSASGNHSHAEGNNTNASGNYSHAEGDDTTASGVASHAEGDSTIASAKASHAEGYYTNASGDYSHAEGYCTIASNYAAHASGKFSKDMTVGASVNNKIGDVFTIGNGTSNATKSNAFRATYAGEIYGTSAFQSSGADYAEYFEWLDGNTEDEDRVGYFVTMEGNKIKKATSNEDYILGIVSAQPCIVGNSDEDWLGRWQHDEFGRFLKREVKTAVTEWKEVQVNSDKEDEEPIFELKEIETGEYVTGWDYVPNPDYDPNQTYTERKDRKEWSAVGMMGVLAVRDDGTCKINGFCTVKENGIATATNDRNGYRVIERVTENIVKVVFR